MGGSEGHIFIIRWIIYFIADSAHFIYFFNCGGLNEKQFLYQYACWMNTKSKQLHKTICNKFLYDLRMVNVVQKNESLLI